MKKHTLSSLIIFSMIFSPVLKADQPLFSDPAEITTESPASEPTEETQPGSSLDDTTPLAVDPSMEPPLDQSGTPVGQASNEGMNAAKRRQWQNIAIAVCAVAVAVTALILVSSNDGHKKH